MSDARVSVIVPAYNHAAFIGAALDSVAAQTHGELELIVVDDCSSDGTLAAFERWRETPAARRLARIELVRHAANRGAHTSLNEGMQLARGEYFCFLNSDDCFAPARLATLLERMRASGSRFAFSAVMPIDAQGRRSLRSPLERAIATAGEEIAVLPSASFGFLHRQLAVSTGNFLVHRSVPQQIGGFAPLRYCHDWDFALRAFMLTEPVFVNEYLYLYRIHEANSFAGLQDQAVRETYFVHRDHFQRCLVELPENPLAPSPANWPGVFEYFIDLFEIADPWAGVCRQRGHVRRYLPRAPMVPRLSRYSPVPVGEGVAPPPPPPATRAWRKTKRLARRWAGKASA